MVVGKAEIIRTKTGYKVPAEIAQHVSFIAGLEEFPQVSLNYSIFYFSNEISAGPHPKDRKPKSR